MLKTALRLDLVDDHLLVECAKWHGRTDLLIATSSGFDAKAYFEAQLRALAAIGLLRNDEATHWRRRFEAAAQPDEELRVDESLRERVERYLESLLPERLSEDIETRRLESALQVLEDIGVLSDADVWFDRVLPDEDDEDEDDWAQFEGHELRQVLLGPAEKTSGLGVTSLEVYDDGVLVRWSQLVDAGAGVSGDDEPELVLSDDVGTTYEYTSGSFGGGGTRRTRGEGVFVPAVPDAASQLVLECAGRRHAFQLDP